MDDPSWTTCSLVLHVGIVLTYHLIQEVIVYQIALAVRVLLVGSHGRRDIISLEADG